MKITAKIRLFPDEKQAQTLRETLQRTNAACDCISTSAAWENRTFNRNTLHHLRYYAVRSTFGLSAQMAVRALTKVVDSCTPNQQEKRQVQTFGAFAYLVTSHSDSPEPKAVACYVGVANIASTRDGAYYSDKTINRIRHQYQHVRTQLQGKGTQSAKRLLKNRAGKERRFVQDVNHHIAQAIVKTAKGTGRGIFLEELKGIRSRTWLRKPQRTQLHSVAFNDLQQKILYKVQLAGEPIACGFSAHADINAAVNSGRRALVNAPHTDTAEAMDCKPLALAMG